MHLIYYLLTHHSMLIELSYQVKMNTCSYTDSHENH